MKMGILNRVLNNSGYKVFSLLLAVIIWSLIQGEQILEENREIRVYLHSPEGHALAGETVRVVAATVRGPRLLMSEAPPKLEANIHVPPRNGMTVRIRVTKEDITNWNNRLGLTIHDPFINVFIDERQSRELRVKHVFFGTPAEGYFTKKVQAIPNIVKITGLRSDLQKLSEIVTEPVDINGINSNRIIEVDLIPPVGYSKENLSSQRVSLSLEVKEEAENRRYSSIPIEVIGSDYPTTINPKVVSIVIQAASSVLRNVKSTDLEAFIEARDLEPGRYENDIKLKIPPDTVLIESSPEKVKLTIQNKKTN